MVLSKPKKVQNGREEQGETTKEDFFPEFVRSEEESLEAVKKLVAISISSILYYRNMFPDSDYGKRHQNGADLHMLDKGAESKGAKEVVKCTRAVFKAIEKKYLKSLVIGFLTDPDEPDNLTEAYVFQIKYNEKLGVSISREAKGDVSKTIVDDSASKVGPALEQIMEKLKEVCRSQKTFKKDAKVYMTLKMRYNESKPDDFVVPDLYTESESEELNFQNEVAKITCGGLKTKYHIISTKIRVPEMETD